MYTLTDTHQIACHGSNPDLDSAIDYAKSLQSFGLCKSFSIGTYIAGKFTEVYKEKDGIGTLLVKANVNNASNRDNSPALPVRLEVTTKMGGTTQES